MVDYTATEILPRDSPVLLVGATYARVAYAEDFKTARVNSDKDGSAVYF
jgi:hypothetical protein